MESVGKRMMKRKRSDSPEPSCVSMKSDRSMGCPYNFRDRDSSTDVRSQKKKSNISKNHLDSIFQELEHKVITLIKNELKRFRKLLGPDYPACTEREVEDEEDLHSVREGALKITLHVLKNMNHTDLANTLHNKSVSSVYQTKLKSKLREKFKRINEGISQHGSSALLNEIYTELYITEGWSGDINNEHESIRSVLTKGVAGIGKTVSVQKFILDWTEGKANQDIFFMFPLPFRELNLMKQQKLMVLIFDGLDECRLPLNFQKNERLCDVTEPASVDVLLTNLIKGNLLPSALLWITSRPGAANQIPPERVDQVTEVRGFSDPQKEEYFRKRISDQSLANKIITHMKSSRSLDIMCHIPVFCWISATVLERMLGEAESGEIPKTLTQMFTHFLIFQIKHKHQKYHQKCDSDPQQTRESILALGKLAFQQLEKGNLIFYEEDLRECGIDVREVSVYSGVCTQIFREEFGLHLGKVFSFVHLSVQEFLAALYAFISYISRNVKEQHTTDLSDLFRKSKMSDFLRSAVDKALQSENGHLDLFLRFLLGISLEFNQTLLRGLILQTGSSSHSKQETVEYIKEKIRENPSPEKSINLFHCLNELNDHSLVQEVQTYLNREGDSRLSGTRLSPAQWSALVFVLLNSEQKLDMFNLRKYDRSEECLLRLLPVVKASRKAEAPVEIGLLLVEEVEEGGECTDRERRGKETRWKGSKACSIGAGFKLFYYGVDSKRNGVGVFLKEEFVRNVLEVKRVSDRVMSLMLEIEGVMLNVVSGYAPQVGCELEEKERFWSELDEVIESIPTGERVVIGADFNGHVGEGSRGDEEVMGKFGVKEWNIEGQMVVDFAKRMDMGVVNTYFQKREEHRVTYKSGGRSTQVDYILCRRGNLKEISDCKVVVGESVARQHRMVVCRMTLMVCKKKRSKIEKKTKWWKLKKEECCEEFRQKLRQALGG
ncbi:hypothetical protein QTP70_000746 [Hemibagrus guttatus]|uniref:FISNA domain-containing protein n=1 Tax=Hemibagrus guttatus TaxID=175788 RepID=A0AAE0QYH1_9TELE|nr:hypothetical protein QTP70_000746 [Hemibagrus guttatus]